MQELEPWGAQKGDLALGDVTQRKGGQFSRSGLLRVDELQLCSFQVLTVRLSELEPTNG